MAELNRRDFIAATAAAAAFGACMSCPLHGAAAAKGKREPVDVGTPADFPKDGIYDRWVKEHSFFIVRNARRLYAASATCTHKRFTLVEDDGAMKCPKHGSIFNLSGKPTKAPARKPLPRYGIALGDGGRRIVVDPSREFSEKQWDKPEAFIAL